MMDIDMQDQIMEDALMQPQIEAIQSLSGGGSRSESKKPLRIVVDDAHPFDLEGYIAGYTGRGAVYRLFHIMNNCPALAQQAYQLAIQRITSTPNTPSPPSSSASSSFQDPSLYRTAVSLHNSLPDVDSSRRVVVDNAWADQVHARNVREKNKLETELKTYLSNSIKESIRMAHRDLGDFHRATGDDASALKHYTKSREYCSSAPHVLEMCISVLELLLEQRNFSQVSTYVFKAEAAFDAAVASGSTSNIPSQSQSQKKGSSSSSERERIQAKLDIATGLAHFVQGHFEKAAQVLLRLPPPKALGDWIGKIVNPGDIAIIATLSALATYSREAIKAQILKNESFGVYLEHEPYVRDLLDAYMGSKFKSVLELLEKHSTRHALDIHIYSHLNDITSRIRDRALVLYFKPFASIKLSRMGAAFGVSEDEMERLVVGLIQSGEIKGRVDRRNGILKANVVDQRSALIARALQTASNIQASNRKLLLRMRLQQADLVVKAARTQGSGTGAGTASNIQTVDALMD